MANLELCKAMKKFDMYVFIVILHHFHLLFRPDRAEDLSKIMQFLKRNITRNINYVMGFTVEGAINESLLRLEADSQDSHLGRSLERLEGIARNAKLKNTTSRLEGKLETLAVNGSLPRLGIEYKIYEEVLKKHYLRLFDLRQLFVHKYGTNQTLFPRFRWEKSFRDHYIRNQQDFDEHVRYIYENPIKHNISDPLNYKYIFTKYSGLISEY